MGSVLLGLMLQGIMNVCRRSIEYCLEYLSDEHADKILHIQVLSVILTKATSGEATTTSSSAPARLRVALKYSSSSFKLSVRVVTVSVTFTV